MEAKGRVAQSGRTSSGKRRKATVDSIEAVGGDGLDRGDQSASMGTSADTRAQAPSRGAPDEVAVSTPRGTPPATAAVEDEEEAAPQVATRLYESILQPATAVSAMAELAKLLRATEPRRPPNATTTTPAGTAVPSASSTASTAAAAAAASAVAAAAAVAASQRQEKVLWSYLAVDPNCNAVFSAWADRRVSLALECPLSW
jgi:hypothetical protein